MRPFIYIASLRRTGSTVLSEALTLFPYCFILREPRFGENRFAIKPGDLERFANYGIDIIGMKKRWLDNKRGSFIEAFKYELVPQLSSCLIQIGVKEIRHEGWREWFHHFPEMRILLTGRDPRDIYISLYYRVKSGKGNWSGEYSPESVAEDLKKEFKRQIEMFKEAN